MTGFSAQDADQYFARNRDVLTLERAATDPVIRILEELAVLPVARRILEVGCANGWRLAAIRERYPTITCIGVEPSANAREDAKRFPTIIVNAGSLGDGSVVPTHDFDAVIVAFTFHWLDPSDRLGAFRNLDGQLAPGGLLCLMDFLPKSPHSVPYHHREGVFTYKANYGWIARSVLGYPVIVERTFDYDVLGAWCDIVPDGRRCAVQVLRKPLALGAA